MQISVFIYNFTFISLYLFTSSISSIIVILTLLVKTSRVAYSRV